MLLVPFEAVERIDPKAREIHLRSAREVFGMATPGSLEESHAVEGEQLGSSLSMAATETALSEFVDAIVAPAQRRGARDEAGSSTKGGG
jgi:hypothetical protein